MFYADYSFASEDGINVSAAGSQKAVGPKPENVGTVSRGSYSYTSPEGLAITVNWVADENGFQAKGDHLPVAPPMPEHVRRQIAAATQLAAATAEAPAKFNRDAPNVSAFSASEGKADGNYSFA